MSTNTTEPAVALGSYRLIGQIGEGGMGVVYLARGPGESRVAVKVLRPHVVGDATGRARLAREVTSLRRVRSARIAEVYDADPWGSTPYIVTRYVAGPSLREVVDTRGPLSGEPLRRLARGLAEALDVVHRADVLHRDVKPSNVLMENGDPVLIDFGLAQLSDDMTLTQSGWVLGTPGYLAPEILYGDRPTPAADVHAWAAAVVFAATGHGPYGGGPAVAVIDRIRRGEANLAGLPSALVDVVGAALRPDPANRPTARQLLDMLDVEEARGWRQADAVDLADEPTMLERIARTPTADPPTLAAPLTSSTATEGASSNFVVPAEDTEPEWGRWRKRIFWLSILCIVVAATMVAPEITLLWVVIAGWALRTADLAQESASRRRSSRGARRSDPMLGAFLVPWYAGRRLLGALANAGWLCIGAAPFLLLARLGPAVVAVPGLLIAGLIVGLGAWYAPMAADTRAGGRLVSSNLPRTGLGVAVVIVLLLSIASGLLATHQIVGTTYFPL